MFIIIIKKRGEKRKAKKNEREMNSLFSTIVENKQLFFFNIDGQPTNIRC